MITITSSTGLELPPRERAAGVVCDGWPPDPVGFGVVALGVELVALADPLDDWQQR